MNKQYGKEQIYGPQGNGLISSGNSTAASRLSSRYARGGRGEGGNGGGGHNYFLSRPAASHVGPWNPLEHRHWNLVPFGTQLPPFLHGAPAQGSGVLCEGGAAPKCKIQAKYIRIYFCPASA